MPDLPLPRAISSASGLRRAEHPMPENGAGRMLRDGDWFQSDWVEDADAPASEPAPPRGFATQGGGRAAPQDSVRAPHAAPQREDRGDRGPQDDFLEDDFLEDAGMDQDRRRPAAASVTPPHAVARREAPRETRTGETRAGEHGGGWNDALSDAWGSNAPQALPRATRVGPLIGPIDEEEPPPPPGRRATPLPHPAAGAYGAAMADEAQRAPRSRAEPQPFAPPDEQRMPREPLRHGPPEQYLPPHLRSEPRVSGHAPVAAPVLSRDDVHRLQSVLYELGECRRLMEGAMGAGDEAQSGA